MTIAFFDGLCESGSPGLCCYGYAIYNDNNASVTGYGCIGRGTNNFAEYTAAIKTLKKAIELKIESLILKGDSMLVINQLRGVWEVRSPNILPIWERAARMARKFQTIKFEWIPRELNVEADTLSRIAYRDALSGIPDKGRLERAGEIVEAGLIRPVSEHIFEVKNYIVDISARSCTCKDNQRGFKCKHIIASEMYQGREASGCLNTTS